MYTNDFDRHFQSRTFSCYALAIKESAGYGFPSRFTSTSMAPPWRAVVNLAFFQLPEPLAIVQSNIVPGNSVVSDENAATLDSNINSDLCIYTNCIILEMKQDGCFLN